MNKFLKTATAFLVIFILFDKLFYPFILISPSLENDNRLEKVIKGGINKELIIIGSSRGARNIIARQIEDSLGLSCYNLSYPGSNIEFHEFLLRSLIRFNSKPKLVLLAVDEPGELLPDESLIFRLDRLYPLARYSVINEEMISREEKNQLSKFFVLARINKKNFDIRKKHFSALDTILPCGSMPVSFQRTDKDFSYVSTVQRYEAGNEQDNKISAFRKFQDLCLNNEVGLILVFSPNFQPFDKNFYNRIRLLAPNVNCFVYDTTKSVYYDRSFYYDKNHLQTEGAKIFTSEIIEFIRDPQHTHN